MLLIWSGKGYKVPLSAALSTIGTMVVTDSLGIEISDDALGAVAAFISGVFVWKLHHWLADRKSALCIVDNETGESVSLEIKHDFYWIPLKYWGVTYSIGGILIAVNVAYPGIYGL